MADSSCPLLAPPVERLHLLLSPRGGLCSDGQLRELMRERRSANADVVDGGIWCLSVELCQRRFAVRDCEAVVLGDHSAALWLQLRFGGDLRTVELGQDWLVREAGSLPPPAAPADLGLKQSP